MNPNGVHDPGNDQFGETCSEEGHVHGCPGNAGGDHELDAAPDHPECRCPDRPAIGPHRAGCPVAIEAGKRLRALNQQADDLGIGYGATVRFRDDAPDPEWFEDAEGFVRAPLSYENREGDPTLSGAFDRW